MPKTITVTTADVDLFHVALAQYGDATAWLAIADANSLSNADISGLGTLTIPDWQPSFAGGAPTTS